jgi:cytochrome c553
MNGDEGRAVWGSSAARWSIFWLVVVTIVLFAVGFVLLPLAQKDFTVQGLWAAICRAAGVPAEWAPADTLVAPQRTTQVVLEHSLTRRATADAVGRGGSLAIQQCTMCHGAQGVSAADTPNLAGQYREVIVKQLLDYKNGDRTSTVMQALASRLSLQDANDLAAYYVSLPKTHRTPAPYDEPTPALVRVGDPLRSIGPCSACHGGIDRKIGTPWLEGMPKQYLVDQLRQFASGARRNDNYAQMRNIARAMTEKEIDEVAEYYARDTRRQGG